jgi:ribosomal protein L32
MPARRSRPRRPERTTPQQPEAPEAQPQAVTCPGCGAVAQLADHSCPQCGQLFYERPGGRVGREPAGGPSRQDPRIAEFAQRMEQTEKWTRLICTVAGVVFALVAVMFLLGLGGFPLIGGRLAILGAFVFLVLSVACLQRGLGRRDADVDRLGR